MPGCGAEPCVTHSLWSVPQESPPVGGCCQVPGFRGAPLLQEGGRQCLSQLCLLGLESDCVNTQQMGLVNRCWR